MNALYRHEMRRRLLLVVIALLCCLSGCGEEDARAHLVRIESVEQIWEKPFEVRLRGEGFPVGARGRAHLVGTLYAPEARPRKLALTLPCRALHGEEALIELRSPETADLAEGPFEGRIEVEFGSLSAARIMGRIERAVVRVGEAEAGLGEKFAQRQRAQTYQRSLGLAGLELTERGVVVSQLSADGSAARAGLLVGDVIVRAFGAPVQLPGDVWSSQAAPRTLEVKRHGEPALRTIALPSERHEVSAPWVALGLAVLGAALGALLAFASQLGALWSPQSSEYWLKVSCVVSLTLLVVWWLEGGSSLVRDGGHAFLCGLFGAMLTVYWTRRARPTLLTRRDASLAPLL